jgi:hypothetical protein
MILSKNRIALLLKNMERSVLQAFFTICVFRTFHIFFNCNFSTIFVDDINFRIPKKMNMTLGSIALPRRGSRVRVPFSAPCHLRSWRNRQTRTFEGRVGNRMGSSPIDRTIRFWNQGISVIYRSPFSLICIIHCRYFFR